MSPRSAARLAGPAEAAPVFAALGDETRLALMARLGAGEPQSIAHLALGMPITRQAVTKHLQVLARLVALNAERAAEERRLAQEAEATRLAEMRRAADAEANAREEAELREADRKLAREVDELLESFPPEETEARAVTCELSEVQLLLYSDILPEGERRWMIPVSLSNHPERDAELATAIGNSPTITIAESTYYICRESHGIPKAVEAVRRGRELALARRAILELSMPFLLSDVPVPIRASAGTVRDKAGNGMAWAARRSKRPNPASLRTCAASCTITTATTWQPRSITVIRSCYARSS